MAKLFPLSHTVSSPGRASRAPPVPPLPSSGVPPSSWVKGSTHEFRDRSVGTNPEPVSRCPSGCQPFRKCILSTNGS